MKNFKKVWSFLLLLVVSVVIGACGAPQAPSQSNSSEESTEESAEGSSEASSDDSSAEEENSEEASTDAEGQSISVMIPEWGVPSDELLKEFTDSTGIEVEMQETSWDDIHDKVATAAAGGTAAADVIEVDWSWAGSFSSAGWLEALELDEETVQDIPTLEQFESDGTYYAVPYSNDFRIAFQNMKHFNDAGVEAYPETWDEVISGAEAIKEAGDIAYPIALPSGADENATTTYLWLSYTYAGQTFNDDGTLNEDAAAQTLSLIEDLHAKELIDPALVNGDGFDAYNKITLGETSSMIGPSSFVNSVESEEDSQVVDQVQPGQLPGKDGLSEVTVPFTEALGVSAQSENKEAATEFVKWYTSKETQEKLIEDTGNNPTRTSAIESLNESGAFGKHGDVFLDMARRVETVFPNGVPAYYNELSAIIYNTVNQLASGQLTADEATQQMVTEVNDLVEAEK